MEKIQIYTHSRVAAFGIGYTEALLEMIKAHSTASFVKEVDGFLRSWQSSNGDSKKTIDDFVKRMQNQYGIKVTVN